MLGFLSPDGEFYQCKYYGHLDLANEILQKRYKTFRHNEVETLCDLGWAIIQDGFVGFVGWHNQTYTTQQDEWFVNHYNKMELAQKQAYDTTKEISDLLKEE